MGAEESQPPQVLQFSHSSATHSLANLIHGSGVAATVLASISHTLFNTQGRPVLPQRGGGAEVAEFFHASSAASASLPFCGKNESAKCGFARWHRSPGDCGDGACRSKPPYRSTTPPLHRSSAFAPISAVQTQLPQRMIQGSYPRLPKRDTVETCRPLPSSFPAA